MKEKKDRNEITCSEPIESVSAAFKKDDKKKKLTPEEKLELERRELGPHNYNRKVRRSHLRRVGLLKAKNKFAFGSENWNNWYDKTRTEGRRLFEENDESVRKQQEWYLERIDENKRKSLTDFYTKTGLTEKEVKEMVEQEMTKWYDSILGNKEKIEARDEKRKQSKV
jgi:hypothetical protein